MKKAVLPLLVLLVALTFGMNVISADECTDCQNSGKPCGLCGRSCKLYDDGVCRVSDYDQELFDAAECAKNAKSYSECSKCTGYRWNSSSSSCVVASYDVNINSDLVCEYEGRYNNVEVTYTIGFNKNDSVVVYRDGSLLSKKVSLSYLDNIDTCPKDENIYIKENSNSISIRSNVSCGNIDSIPAKFPEIVSLIVRIIQVAVPIILILMGMIDLFKGITAQKEDELKKGQQMFIKRLVVGVIIFFAVIIVKLLVSIVADADTSNITSCIDCFLSGVDNCRR